MEKLLTDKLQMIAGNNVLGLQSKTVEGLVRAVFYLVTQYRIAAKNAGYEKKEVENVIENCCKFLGVPTQRVPDADTESAEEVAE